MQDNFFYHTFAVYYSTNTLVNIRIIDIYINLIPTLPR